MSEFISKYKKADGFASVMKCYVAKMLHAQVVSPLGRIVLLPSDYERMKNQYEIDETSLLNCV